MKTALALLFSNLTALAFAIGAVYIASLELPGWGWLVFASIMTTSYFSSTND